MPREKIQSSPLRDNLEEHLAKEQRKKLLGYGLNPADGKVLDQALRLERMQKRLKNERKRSEILAHELKKADIIIEQLIEKAQKDKLTQILNRNGIEEVFEKIKRLNVPACAMLFDGDRFKSVNDSYGHNTGDRALMAIADRLRNLTRDHDIVGRWGGEEFLIIFVNTTAEEIYERFKKDAKGKEKAFSNIEPIEFIDDGGEPRSITLSAGIKNINLQQDNLNDTIGLADKALYKAKERGRNQFVIFPDEGETEVVT